MSWKGITKRVVCVLQIKWNHFSCSPSLLPHLKNFISTQDLPLLLIHQHFFPSTIYKRREDERGRKGKRERESEREADDARKGGNLRGAEGKMFRVITVCLLIPPLISAPHFLCSSHLLIFSSPLSLSFSVLLFHHQYSSLFPLFRMGVNAFQRFFDPWIGTSQ